MYLSRIPLNIAKIETMRALTSPNMLHGAVAHSLDTDGKRSLWRIDWLKEEPYLLVLSHSQPDFFDIARRYGFSPDECPWEIKPYDPFLDRLCNGQQWRFRLRANPVRSSAFNKDEKEGRGKVFAHVTVEQQKHWLSLRGNPNGFVVENSAFDVVHSQWSKFRKGQDTGREVSLHMVSFEGILTITDISLFRKALIEGIGRAKAYGCGLMTLARIRGTVNDE